MEIWKKIPIEHCKFYEASSQGRIRSIDYLLFDINGHKRFYKSKIRKPRIHNGYKRLSLTYKKKNITYKVARLIAITFIPNPKNKPQVNHLKGKLNDSVDALEWTTASENIKHAYDTGLIKPKYGEDNPQSKLTEKQVKQIRKLYKQGLTQQNIADQFHINRCNISEIVNFKLWKHIV